MKVEYYTGSLDGITHWLNIETEKEIEGHTFFSETIESLPQGLIAKAIFLTPEEKEKAGSIKSFKDEDTNSTDY